MKRVAKRNFFKAVAATLATATALALTGCGGSASSLAATPESSSTSAVQSVETQGSDETFYLVSGNKAEETSRMRHCWVDRGYFYQVLTFRSLFLADSSLQDVKPDLASGYEVSEDGLTYTITMKDDLKWSDGEPLGANDVDFSIRTLLRAAQSNGIYTTAFTKIVGAAAWADGSADTLEGLSVEGNTITIRLSEKFGNMIPVLAQFTIYPEHCLKDADPLEIHNNVFWEMPVCSGMYYVSEFNSGNYFVLEPNPYYEGTAPQIKKVQVNFVGDYVTEAQANRVDYYNTSAPGEISEIEKLSSYTKFPVDIMFYRYFICNLADTEGNTNAILADKRVREAFLYAIDTATLIDSIFPELATRTCTGVPSYDSNYDSSLDQYAYDPEKAKALLAEANYDFSTPLRIRYYYSDQATIDFMDAIAYYLSEVGITCDVQKFQESGTQGMFVTRDYDLAYKGLSAFNISEWYTEYSSTHKNFRNILGGNTAFDALNAQLLAAASESERSDVLKKLQALEQEELLKLPLTTFKNIIFINTDRVNMPDNVEFGNPWYRYDMHFEDWTMK